MTFTNMVLVGVAVFAILGAIGAFTIAYRRSQASRPADPLAGLSAETRRADRSMVGVRIEAPVVVEEDEVVEPEVVEEPAPVAVRVLEAQRVIEVSPEEAGVTRRQFFNRAISATFFSFLGLMTVSSLAMFWPKLTGGFGSDVDAGPVSDLLTQVVTPKGSVVPVFVPEARAYVVPAPPSVSDQFAGFPVVAGGLMALFQRCVHLGCRVPWCATAVGFECPCHGSKYNSIGEYFGGPAPRNLDRFVVEVVDSRFIIKTGSIIETSRATALSVPYPQGPSCIGAVAAAPETGA
ncbi:MAG: ubiquinol-cytochrome c reductase iron-sulfur subunit [Actinobacteria bacterium]|nr:ubiquinol-cytochrome c reductase iron-sulfur subunit [Actinomycetota bacterium]